MLLDEFFLVFQKVIGVIESNTRMKRKFDGLIALSNPKYNIYIERFSPSKTELGTELYSNKWGLLQDKIVRYFEGDLSVLDIAEKHDLEFSDIRAYVQKFADCGLIELVFDEVERNPTVRVLDK
jgi:aminopeptidase-like protein